MLIRLTCAILFAALLHAPLRAQVQSARFSEHPVASREALPVDHLRPAQDEAVPSFGQRIALAAVGSLVAGLGVRELSVRNVDLPGVLLLGAYGAAAAAGSGLAGVPADNPNVWGSVTGALLGASPLLLDVLEGDTGDTTGIEMIVGPIALITIPLGAAAGGRWLRF